jgi:hypothetical protein
MHIVILRVNSDGNNKTISALIKNENDNLAIIKSKLTSERLLFNGSRELYSPITLANAQKLIVLPRFAYHDLGSCNVINSNSTNDAANGATNNCAVSGVTGTGTCTVNDTVKFNNADIEYGPAKIDVWENKRELINRIYNKLLIDKGLIIKLDTGGGKTVIVSELIRMLKKKAVIIVKDSTLQAQMYNDILANIDIEPKYVALRGGKIVQPETEETKILICIINSARIISDISYWEKFGVAIFDECHTYCSKKNSAIFKYCQLAYMVGLSANPEKPWNNALIRYNIGPIYDCDVVVKKKPFSGQVNIIKYAGPDEFTRQILNKNGFTSVAKMVEQFMQDGARNELLINVIKSAVDTYQYGFVFCMRNDFLDVLANLFSSRFPDIEITVLNSKACQADKDKAYNSASVVFTNYAYSEGLNLPRMLFIVHASPYKTNGKQITGRTLRGDLSDARAIYDIIDIKTSLKSQFYERKKNYNDRGYEIRDVTAEMTKCN